MSLYSNLYIASQAREGDLDEFFAHKNYAFPVSSSECGKLRAAEDKSEFTQLLHTVFEPQYEESNMQMKVIDGTAFFIIYRFGQGHQRRLESIATMSLSKQFTLFLRELIEWILIFREQI